MTFTWGPAEEVTAFSNLVASPHTVRYPATCGNSGLDITPLKGCGKAFEVGQWVRFAYGPRGGIPYHDDCVPATEHAP